MMFLNDEKGFVHCYDLEIKISYDSNDECTEY